MKFFFFKAPTQKKFHSNFFNWRAVLDAALQSIRPAPPWAGLQLVMRATMKDCFDKRICESLTLKMNLQAAARFAAAAEGSFVVSLCQPVL